MFLGRYASTLTSRAAGLVGVGVLTASMLVPAAGAAGTDPAALRPAAATTVAGPPPRGVSPQFARDAMAESTGAWPMAKPPPNNTGLTTSRGSSCRPYVNANMVGFGHDEYLEETIALGLDAGVSCDVFLDNVSGEIALVDRSPSFNGESFDGDRLGSSDIMGVGIGASGSVLLTAWARLSNGARLVEPVLSLTLSAPHRTLWATCGPVPGMVYYACDGLGTSELHVELGASIRATGLTQACRDQTPITDDAEMARLTVFDGLTPASTQILQLIPSIYDQVIAFKQALCSTTEAEASGFATTRGQQLWDNAVIEARNTVSDPDIGYDDRPLYWARLSMTAAIHQWRPSFAIDLDGMEQTLDWAARGMNSHTFTLPTIDRVLVTGFDPFSLDAQIMTGNPSAASVLGLDNTTLAGAEVQVVILPVRYDDFDANIVESAVTSHLTVGPQEATLITTVSQQPSDRFDLEYYNGRNRGHHPDTPDNRNEFGGAIPGVPVEPTSYNEPPNAPRRQFAESTLPFGAMLPVNFPFDVQVNYTAHEQEVRGQPPVQERADFFTSGWVAVAGSGGDFLSNEVAYRVTEMRRRLGSATKAGHIHTPPLNTEPDLPPLPARRTDVVTQYRQILAAAITGGPPFCGEPSCTPVQDDYISHFTGPGCTGRESYYTPYFNFDGVRRSWDGGGIVGTELKTLTHRSWKGSDGACHDDWPSGNTLTGFVRIYR